MPGAQRWLRQLVTALQARFVRGGIRFIASRVLAFRIEVSGREHVPAREPLIVAGAPHRNWVDGFLLLLALPPQPRVIFLGTEHTRNRLWRRALLWLTGGVETVSTTSALNREALQAGLRVLARGERLGILPEGWHHLDDPVREIGELQRGVAYLAQHGGRRVLPVAIAGGKPLWRGKTLRMRIGAPLEPPPATAGKADQQAWSDELRATLQGLLPPEPDELPVARRRWRWLTTLFQ